MQDFVHLYIFQKSLRYLVVHLLYGNVCFTSCKIGGIIEFLEELMKTEKYLCFSIANSNALLENFDGDIIILKACDLLIDAISFLISDLITSENKKLLLGNRISLSFMLGCLS